MRSALLAAVALIGAAPLANAAPQIRGHYVEARSCDVYTGPCFANAEMGLAGREAVMAWKVEQGGWNGVDLKGLSVAVVVKAERGLGTDGVFPAEPGKIDSVVLVDDTATSEQESALLSFVKNTAAKYTENVTNVVKTPIEFDVDHYTCVAKFSAKDAASIETRKLDGHDCVCSNEMVYYKPLNESQSVKPAYTLVQSFQGKGLDGTWKLNSTRSAFVATFRN